MLIKYSIIVPIYNVELYLLECLQSIKNQTLLANYECLLIDDGSLDDSGRIACDFSKKNENFFYYKKENGGLSDARNYGLNISTGEYIIFIDSDDLIHKNYLEIINAILNENMDTDLLYINFKKFMDGNLVTDDNNILDMKYQIITTQKLMQFPNFAWARIAKRVFYDDNHFPKGYIYEDMVTTTILNTKVTNIIEINEPLYYYRKRAGSITTVSAIKQFELFNTAEFLNKKCNQLKISNVYFTTTFINLTKSVVVSLARINNRKDFYFNLKKSWTEYNKVSLLDGLKCESLFIFKFLFIILRLKYFSLPFYFLLKMFLKIKNM